jgi:hypothetical protein
MTCLLSHFAVNILGVLRDRWAKPVEAKTLPILSNHLGKPLAEEEKIPVTQNEFDGLVSEASLESPRAEVTAEQLATLFRISEREAVNDLRNKIDVNIIKRSPPEDGTESVFHSTWDLNISDILSVIIPAGKIIRDSNHHTSTGLQRPDYGFLIKNHCIFRGEEKAPNSTDNPEAELIDKLLYSYEPLPYILGMSCACFIWVRYSLSYHRISRNWSGS